MKKDIVIAVIIGFVLGGSMALAAVNLPNILKKTKPSTITELTSLSPAPSVSIKPVEIELTIEKPKNESISEKKTIEISGKTKPGNIVFIETDIQTKGLEAKEDGSFTEEISLGQGANIIYIASYNEKGVSNSKTITVFYTEEKL